MTETVATPPLLFSDFIFRHSFVIRRSDFACPRRSRAKAGHSHRRPCPISSFRFRGCMAQTQLTWYGQSGFKIVTPGGKTLLIDPWLTNPVFEKGKETLAALKDVDLILLSHGHSDHVGNAVEIGKETVAKLVANFDLAAAVVRVLSYPSSQADADTTGHIGGQLTLLEGEVTVCFVPAWHGSTVRKDENSAPVPAGMPTGLVICIRNG